MKTLVPILSLMLIFMSCDQDITSNVSIVNGRSISAEDFQFAYETSPRSILQGSREEAYERVLDRQITRILMSQEAERLNLHQQAEIERELRYLEDSAIRRELYRQHVRAKVEISEETCREAFKRDQTTLWVQHTVLEPTVTVDPGFWDPQWGHVPINPAGETRNTAEFGSVDIIAWNVLDSRLENMLYALEVGEVSEPLVQNNATHLFRLVNFERNQMATEEHYQSRREHYHSGSKKRAEHKQAFDFVQQVMKPESLIIRRSALDQIVDILWQEPETVENLKNKSESELNPVFSQLDAINDLEIAVFTSGSLSIEDFRFYFKMNPQQLSKQSPAALRETLINTIGLYARDRVFADKGRQEGLADGAGVQEDYQYWRERLLAEKLEQSFYASLAEVDSINVDSLGAQITAQVNELINQLRQNAEIHTNTENLMAVKTSDEGLSRRIDFFANYLN